MNKKKGRPKGTIKKPTVDFHRRIYPEMVKILDDKIKELKSIYK